MSKKNTNFDEELAKFAQKLFEKYVPANVQEYIAERENDEKSVTVQKRYKEM